MLLGDFVQSHIEGRTGEFGSTYVVSDELSTPTKAIVITIAFRVTVAFFHRRRFNTPVHRLTDVMINQGYGHQNSKRKVTRVGSVGFTICKSLTHFTY